MCDEVEAFIPGHAFIDACGGAGSPDSAENGARPVAPAGAVRSGSSSLALPGEGSVTTPQPLAAGLIRAEWATAANRERCAPLAFTSDGGIRATARRASFSGGWSVAFDTRDVRSAYGLARPGLSEVDEAAPATQAKRLRGQWPHFTKLKNLPEPAFAGFGLICRATLSRRQPGRHWPTIGCLCAHRR